MFDDKPSSSDKTDLIRALQLQDVAKAKSLILSGADVNYCINPNCWNALHYASWKGLPEVVESILLKHIKESKFNINAETSDGQTALSLAASGGYEAIVELLLEYHADIHLNNHSNHTGISRSSWTLLHEAAYQGWIKIVQAILDKSDLDAKRGSTALMVAVRRKQPDIAMMLLISGVGLGGVDQGKWTVLHHAARKGWLGVVEMILERQPNLEDETSDGQTALILSASMGHKEVVKRLLESGASLDCRDYDGWTLLQYASMYEWTEIVKLMVLNSKCNINARVVFGQTVLMMAVQPYLEEDVAELLLKHGADVHMKDDMDETVLTSAIDYESSAHLISLLVEKGAYFTSTDYEKICNNSVLKEQVLKDRDICIQAVLNEYNIVCLPAIKELSSSYNIVLPSIKSFQINGGNVLREIEKMVDREIETKSICNVMKVRPFVLQMMAVRSLLDYHHCQ